jgi:hypothetical protein
MSQVISGCEIKAFETISPVPIICVGNSQFLSLLHDIENAIINDKTKFFIL